MDDRASFGSLPVFKIDTAWGWDAILAGPDCHGLATAMAGILPTRRWFGAKARAIRTLTILEAIPISHLARLLVVRVAFATGPDEVYQVPLAFMPNGAEGSLTAAARWLVVEHSQGHIEGVLYDALGDPDFCRRLLAMFDHPEELLGASGKIEIDRTARYEALRGGLDTALHPRLIQGEQSNSSIVFGDRLIMKLFRRVETGLNPDFELSEFLTEAGFANTPAVAGGIIYRQRGETWALAMLQAFVPNRGDAWKFTLDWLNQPVPEIAITSASGTIAAPPTVPLLAAAEQGVSTDAQAAFGGFLTSAARLGQRTAEMHVALASDKQRQEFAPEPFTDADRQAYLSNCREYAQATFTLLREQHPKFSGELAAQAKRVTRLEAKALAAYESLATANLTVDKIRIHGDYHLGQVLATGDDFQIIDFEGEPVRSIAERRQKQLALRDVAGMLRSFHYASRTAAAEAAKTREGDWAVLASIDAWASSWYAWTCVAFLASYLRITRGASFLPASTEQTEKLLSVCLLEKAIYELRYELNNRPDWVYLPLSALEDLLG